MLFIKTWLFFVVVVSITDSWFYNVIPPEKFNAEIWEEGDIAKTR